VKEELSMRNLSILVLTISVIALSPAPTRAGSPSCKVCADQQKACMKNYAGPTCKSEYQMCLKSCGKG
jgi:hypothetical protein